MPPLFPSGPKGPQIEYREAVEKFVEDVRSLRSYSDVVLVANVKSPHTLKLSPLEAAHLLKDRVGVKAAPVVVVRDQNRVQFLSTVLTAISLEFPSVLIVWGDDYPRPTGTSNVRDFSSLGQALREASLVRARARASTEFYAPVDLNLLETTRGVSMARERLRSGAEYLLAQPPTTDPDETFDRHASLAGKAGIRSKVLLSVFPFVGPSDVRRCEKDFGWNLPRRLHREAASGEDAVLSLGRQVIGRLRKERFPGVYVSTRGRAGWAGKLLS